MKTLLSLLVLAALAPIGLFAQAAPVIRFKTYAGTPTAGDCNANTVGVLVGFNTTPSPDAIYDCMETGSSPTWVQRSSGSGTVSSVALTVPGFLSVSGSPITTAGTLAVTLANQNQNLIFAGPASGAAASPTFRALVALDIPDLSGVYQPLDADLTAIAGISASRGGLIRKGATAWEGVALGATGAILGSDGTDAVWLARVSAASTIDFASVPDGGCIENTFTLTGAALGDPVALGVATALPAGVKATARVSATNTAEVQVCNLSGAAVDLSSRSWTVRVVR